MPTHPSDTLVIGGGVCGTYLTLLLARQGHDVLLAEARDALGGRARTARLADPECAVDLGPAWVWPHQRRVLALIEELGIGLFEQFSDGNLVYQDPRLPDVREYEMSTMAGSLRLVGGMQTLTDRMAAQLDPERVWTDATLTDLQRTERGARARFSDGREVDAARVVLAMPPRLMAGLGYDPPLPDALATSMRRVPTWMAGHAKAVAIYSTPFWRGQGRSGDGISHRGPLGELHDASPHDPGPGALFGFFATPASWRHAHADRLDDLVRAQLEAMYGAPAGDPLELLILDWSRDPHVATDADADPPPGHSSYAPLTAPLGAWEGALWLSGSEVAPSEGGYVEGAVVAAEAVFAAIT